MSADCTCGTPQLRVCVFVGGCVSVCVGVRVYCSSLSGLELRLTSSEAERRHCTAACFFISSRLRSVPPFFLPLPHFFPVPFSQPRKMSFSFKEADGVLHERTLAP